jgi:hypothetical protein
MIRRQNKTPEDKQKIADLAEKAFELLDKDAGTLRTTLAEQLELEGAAQLKMLSQALQLLRTSARAQCKDTKWWYLATTKEGA